MSQYAEEYLVKQWEAAAKPISKAIRSFALNSSGRFFVSAAAGEIIDPDSGVPLIETEKVADMINTHIDANQWSNLPIGDIAQILSDEFKDLTDTQRKGLEELQVMLVTNIIGEEEGSEATAKKNLPEKITPLVLA